MKLFVASAFLLLVGCVDGVEKCAEACEKSGGRMAAFAHPACLCSEKTK